MSERAVAYAEGYQQGLRDAVATLKHIEDSLRQGKNYSALEVMLPLLAVARDAVSTLEPGFVSPASGQPPRS